MNGKVQFKTHQLSLALRGLILPGSFVGHSSLVGGRDRSVDGFVNVLLFLQRILHLFLHLDKNIMFRYLFFLRQK